MGSRLSSLLTVRFMHQIECEEIKDNNNFINSMKFYAKYEDDILTIGNVK